MLMLVWVPFRLTCMTPYFDISFMDVKGSKLFDTYLNALQISKWFAKFIISKTQISSLILKTKTELLSKMSAIILSCKKWVTCVAHTDLKLYKKPK
jgi:hypothetical protein